MDDLQLALGGAGVAAVVAVWAYNAWQEKKHRKTAERLFKGEHSDTLIKEPPAAEAPGAASPAPSFERVEPTVGLDDAAPVVAEEAPASVAVEEVIAAPAPVPSVPIEVAAPSAAPLPVDTLAECAARLEFSAPVAAREVDLARAMLRAAGIDKPLRAWARPAGHGEWRKIAENDAGAYADWVLCLQLADRRGAVSAADAQRFCTEAEALATRAGGRAELPDAEEAAQRAQALDEFCAAVDAQFGIHIVEASGGGFAGTKLRGVFEAAGLSLAADGCFHAVDADGAGQFWVANMGNAPFDAEGLKTLTAQGITLTIDVPRVANGAQAFDRMLACARQLARSLGGVLVDAQRAPLADAMLAAIRAKVVELQQRMAGAEIPAGGERALKLFV